MYSQDLAQQMRDIEAALKGLPVESPPGSEDIYGLDTSIAFLSNDLQWMNGNCIREILEGYLT